MELDRDARLGVSIRVLEQVAYDAAELVGAPADLDGRDRRRHDARTGANSDALDLRAHDVVEIDRSMRGSRAGVVRPRQEQQVAHQAFHALVVVEQVGGGGRPVGRRGVPVGHARLSG